MPKVDNPVPRDDPIGESVNDPPFPGLQEEDTRQTVKSPDIFGVFAPSIVPVAVQPSNRIGCYTYFLQHGVGPAVRIVEAQPYGIASRVSLYTTTPNAKILIAGKREFLSSSASGVTQSFSVPLISTMQPLILLTTAEVYAIEVSTATDSEINVIVETYDIDLRDHSIEQHFNYEVAPTGPWSS